ncbi:hypothetical protein EJ04DRAFT_434294, partial [Polyplosphaeria fusca]
HRQTLKYGDKSQVLQTSSQSHRYELYLSSDAGDDDDLEFAGLINHRLAVQEAEIAVAGADSALEQLKSSMAALSEMKEANKTIVGNVTSARTSGHKRFPSKSFKPSHLGGSPLLSVPSSPGMSKKPPTSQPGGMHEVVLRALRTPLVHLLAMQPARESTLADQCRTSPANVRELLPKIAKRLPDDTELWSLTEKGFRELNPYKFTYKSDEDRERAINAAIKAFDRQRLAKDDKLWQNLLPVGDRGKGICLSRLNVRAVEAKPSTPMHKVPGLTDKKKPAAAKKEKGDGKDKEQAKEVKKARDVKEVEPKQKRAVKDEPAKAAGTSGTPKVASSAPSQRQTPSVSADAPKVRSKKMTAAVANDSTTPRIKSKTSTPRDVSQRDRFAPRPTKPAMSANTKPKNPSPLSASPPLNASDFEDDHPMHTKLSGAPSPAKASSGNSDRPLKRKANDLDSDIHNHNLSVKHTRIDRPTPNHTPNGRANGSTPSSGNSLKRKAEDSSTSNTPSTKIRKVTNIDTHVANRYSNHTNNTQISPGESSSTTTSPSIPSLSFRQTVELSQRFQKYYKKYEELYWQLAESDKAPGEGQRAELMKMHKKLEEMKREIKAGAGGHR